MNHLCKTLTFKPSAGATAFTSVFTMDTFTTFASLESVANARSSSDSAGFPEFVDYEHCPNIQQDNSERALCVIA